MIWRDKGHGDYSICDLRVIAPSNPIWGLRLSMTAHVRMLPRKCGFTLIYGQRIFSLDVNPSRIHNNRTGESIETSHWTTWPCDIAEADNGDKIHVQWFGEFLGRANIIFQGKYVRPPYLPEQAGLFGDE